MKTALVCCAKNEDMYLDEWIEYHLKLGFSEIFVYQNDWRYTGRNLENEKVHFLVEDGPLNQLRSYNKFINDYRGKFDWAAFFDVDEFLDLHIDRNLDQFLSRYNGFYAVNVNWRLFGSNGLDSAPKTDNPDDWSVLKRFTKRQTGYDRHTKTILNMKMAPIGIAFVNPHFTQLQSTDTTKTRSIWGPYNYDPVYPIAQLNHYYCKTVEEFTGNKVAKGRADIAPGGSGYVRKIDDFHKYNLNDIPDTHARDLLY